MAMSTWTPSSPQRRSTHGPSTGASPSSAMPRAVKKAMAAGRLSTTTLTWSILLMVMSESLRRHERRSAGVGPHRDQRQIRRGPPFAALDAHADSCVGHMVDPDGPGQAVDLEELVRLERHLHRPRLGGPR